MSKKRPKTTPAEERAAILETPTPRTPVIPDERMLSTGCVLLNLAFSGRPDGGVPMGTYVYFVGDSSSGKTWCAFSLFAEAARNPHFGKYRFVYDNTENGALMDVGHYFGAGVADRLEPPWWDGDTPMYSRTAQQFYYHLDSALDSGPCIYVLDSMDGLNDDADEEKFAAEVHRYETGKGEVPGSYGMAKAKTNKRNINRVVSRLRENGSILVVVSQTTTKIGGQIPGQKTRSGGLALKFFAHLEAWTSVRAPITRTYLRKDREVGATIRVDVQKNRVCGWEGRLEVPFLKGYGLDDLGGSVDYLLSERHWEAPKEKTPARPARGDNDEGDAPKKFHAPEFSFTGTKEQLIQKIQEEGTEARLAGVVAGVWRAVIAGAAPHRKPRYT